MPTATDLVTDLPADFEVFGQAVATSMADLLGGTTGQILAKNSNTDMDFIWVANDQGDITGITATSPLTGGGTSGAVTVGIQAASTTQSGAVQLSDSTSTTSSVLAATPTAVKAAYDKASTAATTSVAGIVQLSDSTSTTSSVLASTPTATKSAYDLANAAIPKSTVTAKGSIVTATASSTPAQLAVGANNLVLTADSTAATGLKYSTDWTTYTPTWASSGTQPVIGNGTLTGQYLQVGKQLFVQIHCLAGTTTTFGTGTYSWSLPFANKTLGTGSTGLPTAGNLEKPGVAAYSVQGSLSSGASLEPVLYNGASITPTSPFTWASGNFINLAIMMAVA